MSTVQEIACAIDTLTARQLEELYLWLDQHHPQPIDTRLVADVNGGLFDTAIQRALADEAAGRTRPF